MKHLCNQLKRNNDFVFKIFSWLIIGATRKNKTFGIIKTKQNRQKHISLHLTSICLILSLNNNLDQNDGFHLHMVFVFFLFLFCSVLFWLRRESNDLNEKPFGKCCAFYHKKNCYDKSFKDKQNRFFFFLLGWNILTNKRGLLCLWRFGKTLSFQCGTRLMIGGWRRENVQIQYMRAVLCCCTAVPWSAVDCIESIVLVYVSLLTNNFFSCQAIEKHFH